MLRGWPFQSQWIFGIGILFVFVAAVLPFHERPVGLAVLPEIKAFLTALAINYLIEGHRGLIDHALNAPVIVWVGQLSYSLYLWQQLFCTDYAPWHWYNAFPINVCFAVLCAVCSFYLLERPLARLRSKLESSPAGPAWGSARSSEFFKSVQPPSFS